MVDNYKSILKGIIATILILSPSVIQAASNDTSTINYSVAAINELNLDGGPYDLTVDTATAGQEPELVTYEGTYDITTNCGTNAKKITAQLNSDMPDDTFLWFDMAPPTGAASVWMDPITSASQNIITGIDATAQANISFIIDLEAWATAGVIESASKTLTVTLTDS